MTNLDRFFTKVRFSDNGCWIWGAAQSHGYGYFWCNGKQNRAHRWLYQFIHGSTPFGLDHLCRNRLCVNPDHLEPVTTKTNLQRSPLAYANRTHCPKGHPYDSENTYHLPTGGRGCKRCRRDHVKQWRARSH